MSEAVNEPFASANPCATRAVRPRPFTGWSTRESPPVLIMRRFARTAVAFSRRCANILP